MRLLPLLPAALLLCTAAVTAPPLLVPRRDVTIDYVVHPESGRAQAVRVSIEAGGAHLRIEGQDIPASIIVDRPAGVARIMVPLLRAYSSLSIERYDPERTMLHRAQFSRGGLERLAGGVCTDWVARAPSGVAFACITDGGLILKGQLSNRHGPVGDVLATSVDYAALPPWTWSIPDGWHDIGPMPPSMLGLEAPR